MFICVGTPRGITAAVLPVRAPTTRVLKGSCWALHLPSRVPHRRLRLKRDVRLYREMLAAIVFRALPAASAA